ncbi:MAG: putative ABC transport system permease protein [Puniceicoccaceae bacterium 5H]|nr:MAG: putative ABC transport system permease protein [Puniceicoccaceae bacterium 5H]
MQQGIAAEQQPAAEWQQREEGLALRLSGRWSLHAPRPKDPHLLPAFQRQIDGWSGRQRLIFDLSAVERFDSRLVAQLFALIDAAEAEGWEIDRSSLPDEVCKLLKLAQASEKTEADGLEDEGGWLSDLGRWGLERYAGLLEIFAFVGRASMSFVKFVTGRARIRWQDFFVILQDTSAASLPIVSLISFLVGLIIAFLGSVVLKQFSAEFAVSYLVGYGMLREMGAVMTGVIMAGRTGAAFAAQIGSMKVNEEIDALVTFGISPMDFIVLPRLLALGIMMPLLTIYANLVGILGGYLVATLMMRVPHEVFVVEMDNVVSSIDVYLGLFKGLVFGLLVAFSGCLRGLQTGSGADSVGRAATKAVVTGITLIIFANAVIDWAAAEIGV